MASLRSKLETALKTKLDDLVAGDCFKGISSDDKVLPCIIVRSVKATRSFNSANGGDGPCNWIVQLEIITEDNASAESGFDDLADAVHSRCDTDGFSQSLSGDGLTVYGFTEPDQIEWTTNGESWMQTITKTIECSLTSAAS